MNETMAKNKQLKDQINVLRKELISAQGESKKLNRNIKRTKRDATSANKDHISGKGKAEETNNYILALKAKHEGEK